MLLALRFFRWNAEILSENPNGNADQDVFYRFLIYICFSNENCRVFLNFSIARCHCQRIQTHAQPIYQVSPKSADKFWEKCWQTHTQMYGIEQEQCRSTRWNATANSSYLHCKTHLEQTYDDLSWRLFLCQLVQSTEVLLILPTKPDSQLLMWNTLFYQRQNVAIHDH